MKEEPNKLDRRNFLKAVGAAGLASTVTETTTGFVSAGAVAGRDDSNATKKKQKPKTSQVPRRKFGKTNVEVPCLCLGGNYSLLERQIILRKALESGVNYWDTAHNYAGGNSELGIGKFLSKNPDVRKKLFIASKASFAKDIAGVEERLQLSLKRMNIKYIDLYYGVHILSDPSQMTDELKQWAKDAKKRKLIRFLGVSTHKNMAKCLTAAAKLGWIDAIMTVYNFRLRQDSKMQAAIEACHKAGIALIAMKCQAAGPGARWAKQDVKVETEEDKRLIDYFQKKGFTLEQAKIKVVLQDMRFTSVCVGMENMAFLNANIDAVRDKKKLSQRDLQLFDNYAKATCSGYCAGCADICDAALPNTPYVSDIMRYLMYYNSYGEHDQARRLFAQIPSNVRNGLSDVDYRLAEDHCPQHLPIRKLITEAIGKLA